MSRLAPEVSRAAVLGAVGGFLACALAILLLPAVRSELVSDVAQMTAAGVACLTTARYARGCRDPWLRAAWVLLSAACASWCAGQAYWTWAARGAAVPFPSAADVGFLGFSLLALLALLLHPAPGGPTARWQRAWDAVMTATAIGLISWCTTVAAVVTDSAGLTLLARTLLLAYPLGDVVLIVLVVLLLGRTRDARTALDLVGLGVVGLSVADSAFIYLAATDSYTSGLVDLGWLGGFLLIAVAGTCTPPAAAADEAGHVRDRDSRASTSLLPYLPVALASTVVLFGALTGRPLRPGEQVAGVVVVGALLARQYLTLRDNTRLAGHLAARERQLRHQAFHDALTGLANRSLFTDRLEHALRLHARDLRRVSVIFLDLDDFKLVNDTFGHAAGDQLLVRVAERLTGALRSGDTVARWAGDEFAVLLEDSGDPLDSAGRLLAALGVPFTVDGQTVPVHSSIGVCSLEPGNGPVSAEALLARADTAMYRAKRAGKNRVVQATPDQDELAPR